MQTFEYLETNKCTYCDSEINCVKIVEILQIHKHLLCFHLIFNAFTLKVGSISIGNRPTLIFKSMISITIELYSLLVQEMSTLRDISDL